jgi:serine/threonine protein kinase
MMAAPSAESPAMFGRYRLVGRLGEGGMSELFIAEAKGAEGFTRTFVLKRLRPELARDKQAVAQFIDEARLQATLVHSNIVPVFDFGRMGSEYFITMEFINGRNLAEISHRCVEKTGFTLDPMMVLYFAHETLQALAYAHAKRDNEGRPLSIVHRDVSPQNILVTASGEVKLFDFGIAKANKRVTHTQAGMLKGNAVFMAPEQARGHDVDARSDLFSLGMVIYYCLTNSFLYRGMNDLDVLFRAACGLTQGDWEVVHELPHPMRDILIKALATDPNERFQSAQEFAAALAPHVMGLKTDAASLMELLFGDDLRAAETRTSGVFPDEPSLAHA